MRTTHVAKMSLVLCRSCSRSLRLQAATRIIVRNYYTRPSCARCLFAVGRRKGSSPWARYPHSRRLRRAFSAGVRGEGVWREEVIVMGIESSCDDTGVAVISGDGRVRGEAIHSQTDIHKDTGGIVPIVAADLHRQNLQHVTDLALERSGLQMEDIDIIAVTVGPGLALCLHAGLDFAKSLAHTYNKPIMPVHHMEAHALTPRLEENIPFPFLVLLVSGGHCLLCIAHGPGQFSRLGQSHDDSPGEALDKLARWMALHTHPDLSRMVGGAAVEVLSRRGDPSKFPLPLIMARRRCCNFSFSGLKTAANMIISRVALEENWNGSTPLPGCEHIAASFQSALCQHLLSRTHRAILFSRTHVPDMKHLVVSGGVASNQYLRSKLRPLLDHYGFTLHCPPPRLCTDNGVMIAWAALEHLRDGRTPVWDVGELDFRARWPLGEDISSEVENASIKLPKLSKL